METFIAAIHIVVCLFLILTVLLQSGSKGGMGGAFGGGGATAGTVFGGSGASNFLRKLTVASAVIFMLTSMVLAWTGSQSGAKRLNKRTNAAITRGNELKESRDNASKQESTDDATTNGDAKSDGATSDGDKPTEPGETADSDATTGDPDKAPPPEAGSAQPTSPSPAITPEAATTTSSDKPPASGAPPAPETP